MHALYVFDAYGTLFDVHSAVAAHAAKIGPDAAAFSRLWRDKQLEYSWTRALMGRYAPFARLTEEALDFAFASFPRVDRTLRAPLLDAYARLEAYREVPDALARLRAGGARTAILSNGSPDMLDSAVSSAGIGSLLDAVLSVDPLATFKTAPAVYALVTERFAVASGDVSFQSSNRWDIAGARAFGFHTVWINRSGAPDEYPDLAPHRILADLDALRE